MNALRPGLWAAAFSRITHHASRNVMRRVAVTGIGLITPGGCGREAVWAALTAGRSGIVRIEEFDTSSLRTNIAGVCRDFRPLDLFDEREMARLDRVSQMAIAATGMATREAGLT